MTFSEKKRLIRLRKYYTIHDDGVAKLNLKKAIKDSKFQNTVKKLRDMKI